MDGRDTIPIGAGPLCVTIGRIHQVRMACTGSQSDERKDSRRGRFLIAIAGLAG